MTIFFLQSFITIFIFIFIVCFLFLLRTDMMIFVIPLIGFIFLVDVSDLFIIS